MEQKKETGVGGGDEEEEEETGMEADEEEAEKTRDEEEEGTLVVEEEEEKTVLEVEEESGVEEEEEVMKRRRRAPLPLHFSDVQYQTWHQTAATSKGEPPPHPTTVSLLVLPNTSSLPPASPLCCQAEVSPTPASRG